MPAPRSALAFLGLGSNQGESVATLAAAVAVLGALPGTRLRGVSSLYRTAPVGFLDQSDFTNAVIVVQTELSPRQLLAACQSVERSFGRVRDVRWGPRTLDVDLLWYDGISLHESDLELPHPRLGERRFVLEPLAELAPDLELPDGRSVVEALAATLDQSVEPVAPPGWETMGPGSGATAGSERDETAGDAAAGEHDGVV